MKKLTKSQVTDLLQAMLDETLKSNDKRICVDSQSPLQETDDGWTMEFLTSDWGSPADGPVMIANNTLRIHLVAEQKVDYYDNEEDEDVTGEWEEVLDPEKLVALTKEVIEQESTHEVKTTDEFDWRIW